MKVLRGVSSSLESPVMKIEAKSLVRRPSGEGGWVSLNVEELLSRWFENPKENHGIVLHAVDEQDRQIVVTDHEEDNGALVSAQTPRWRPIAGPQWMCVCCHRALCYLQRVAAITVITEHKGHGAVQSPRQRESFHKPMAY
jgi:hypothetical protein